MLDAHTRRKTAVLAGLLLLMMLCGGWRPGVSSRAVAEATQPQTTAAATGEPATEAEEDAGIELTDAELSAVEAAIALIADDTTLSLQAKLNAVFERYETLGAVVCVVENGQVTHTFTYGALDRDGTPMQANALFRVGSISKMVTAMGVMRLVEQGDIALDGDLSDMLGVTVRNAQYPDTPVTLRQLMTHTAGLRDSSYYELALQGTVTPLSQLFQRNFSACQFQKDSKPGSAAHYSNFGGGLLGSILEKVSGQTVDAFMNAAVFAPLGITAAYESALLPADAVVSNMYTMPGRRLSETVRDGAPAVTNPDPLMDYTLTAGKLTISAPDLAKLLIALCDGGVVGDTRVLRDDTLEMMRTLQNNIGSVATKSDRGLCMNILRGTAVEGRTLYGHGGKASGMLCAAYFDPTDRTGVVMLTNGCNNRPMRNDVGMLSLAVLRLCYAGMIDGHHVAQDPWLVSDEGETH